MRSITDRANIILIGFSTTGKTTAGRALAQKLGWAFVDTDVWISGMAGQSIPEIFEEHGERHFRELESAALNEALARQKTVIATGGGSVIKKSNREKMARLGWIVLLEAEPESIFKRMQAEDAKSDVPIRPLLVDDDPLTRIIDLKAERHAVYHSVADKVVHTDGLSTAEVVNRILAWTQSLDQTIGE